jgi:hypothetical protein
VVPSIVFEAVQEIAQVQMRGPVGGFKFMFMFKYTLARGFGLMALVILKFF